MQHLLQGHCLGSLPSQVLISLLQLLRQMCYCLTLLIALSPCLGLLRQLLILDLQLLMSTLQLIQFLHVEASKSDSKQMLSSWPVLLVYDLKSMARHDLWTVKDDLLSGLAQGLAS